MPIQASRTVFDVQAASPEQPGQVQGSCHQKDRSVPSAANGQVQLLQVWESDGPILPEQ